MTAPRTRQVYAACDHVLTPWLLRVPEDAAPDARESRPPSWLLQMAAYRALDPMLKYVLTMMRGHLDKNERGSVAYSTLAEQTGLAESTVIGCVARAEKAGWLNVTRNRIAHDRNAVNIYQFVYPAEVELVRKAVDQAAKEKKGAKTDHRVPRDAVYYSEGRKSGEVRKAFVPLWELGSSEWRSLATAPNALDVLIALRSRAIDGQVGMSKLEIARAIGRAGGGPKGLGTRESRARARTRVWEAIRAMIGLGVLKVVRQGGPRGHLANRYAPCIPPSCAHWAAHWTGWAPGATSATARPQPKPATPLRFPGVRVEFRAGSSVAPDAVCSECSRAARLPRRYHHRPGADPCNWHSRYCSGAHLEPVIAGCPDCAAPVADGAAMELCRAAWLRNAKGPAVVTVDANEGDITCEVCNVSHRFGLSWTPTQTGTGAPWLPMDADRLVKVWLSSAHRPERPPIPTEIAFANQLIVEAGGWWKALALTRSWQHLAKDVRYLTGLAHRAGYAAPDTS